MSRSVLTWLAVLFTFAGGFALWFGWRSLHASGELENFGSATEGTPIEVKLDDFTLIERSGQDFHSADMRGKVWVVSFFFASCPGSCRQQNAHLASLEKIYGPRGVTFLSITVDPDNDTPTVLSEYAKEFRADKNNWLFLTGEKDYVKRVANDLFQAPFGKGSHSERFIVINREGKIRGSYAWAREDELDELKAHLSRLLAEPIPEAKTEPAAEKKEAEKP